MKKSGVLKLSTINGTRSMHYTTYNDSIYVYSMLDTKKMADIKIDPTVTINLTDLVYIATIEKDEKIIEKMTEDLKAAVPWIGRKVFGRKFQSSQKVVLRLGVK